MGVFVCSRCHDAARRRNIRIRRLIRMRAEDLCPDCLLPAADDQSVIPWRCAECAFSFHPTCIGRSAPRASRPDRNWVCGICVIPSTEKRAPDVSTTDTRLPRKRSKRHSTDSPAPVSSPPAISARASASTRAAAAARAAVSTQAAAPGRVAASSKAVPARAAASSRAAAPTHSSIPPETRRTRSTRAVTSDPAPLPDPEPAQAPVRQLEPEREPDHKPAPSKTRATRQEPGITPTSAAGSPPAGPSLRETRNTRATASAPVRKDTRAVRQTQTASASPSAQALQTPPAATRKVTRATRAAEASPPMRRETRSTRTSNSAATASASISTPASAPRREASRAVLSKAASASKAASRSKNKVASASKARSSSRARGTPAQTRRKPVKVIAKPARTGPPRRKSTTPASDSEDMPAPVSEAAGPSPVPASGAGVRNPASTSSPKPTSGVPSPAPSPSQRPAAVASPATPRTSRLQSLVGSRRRSMRINEDASTTAAQNGSTALPDKKRPDADAKAVTPDAGAPNTLPPSTHTPSAAAAIAVPRTPPSLGNDIFNSHSTGAVSKGEKQAVADDAAPIISSSSGDVGFERVEPVPYFDRSEPVTRDVPAAESAAVQEAVDAAVEKGGNSPLSRDVDDDVAPQATIAVAKANDHIEDEEQRSDAAKDNAKDVDVEKDLSGSAVENDAILSKPVLSDGMDEDGDAEFSFHADERLLTPRSMNQFQDETGAASADVDRGEADVSPEAPPAPSVEKSAVEVEPSNLLVSVSDPPVSRDLHESTGNATSQHNEDADTVDPEEAGRPAEIPPPNEGVPPVDELGNAAQSVSAGERDEDEAQESTSDADQGKDIDVATVGIEHPKPMLAGERRTFVDATANSGRNTKESEVANEGRTVSHLDPMPYSEVLAEKDNSMAIETPARQDRPNEGDHMNPEAARDMVMSEYIIDPEASMDLVVPQPSIAVAGAGESVISEEKDLKSTQPISRPSEMTGNALSIIPVVETRPIRSSAEIDPSEKDHVDTAPHATTGDGLQGGRKDSKLAPQDDGAEAGRSLNSASFMSSDKPCLIDPAPIAPIVRGDGEDDDDFLKENDQQSDLTADDDGKRRSVIVDEPSVPANDAEPHGDPAEDPAVSVHAADGSIASMAAPELRDEEEKPDEARTPEKAHTPEPEAYQPGTPEVFSNSDAHEPGAYQPGTPDVFDKPDSREPDVYQPGTPEAFRTVGMREPDAYKPGTPEVFGNTGEADNVVLAKRQQIDTAKLVEEKAVDEGNRNGNSGKEDIAELHDPPATFDAIHTKEVSDADGDVYSRKVSDSDDAAYTKEVSDVVYTEGMQDHDAPPITLRDEGAVTSKGMISEVEIPESNVGRHEDIGVEPLEQTRVEEDVRLATRDEDDSGKTGDINGRTSEVDNLEKTDGGDERRAQEMGNVESHIVGDDRGDEERKHGEHGNGNDVTSVREENLGRMEVDNMGGALNNGDNEGKRLASYSRVGESGDAEEVQVDEEVMAASGVVDEANDVMRSSRIGETEDESTGLRSGRHEDIGKDMVLEVIDDVVEKENPREELVEVVSSVVSEVKRNGESERQDVEMTEVAVGGNEERPTVRPSPGRGKDDGVTMTSGVKREQRMAMAVGEVIELDDSDAEMGDVGQGDVIELD